MVNSSSRSAAPRVGSKVYASGEQIELVSGPLRLTVVTVGGGLRELLNGDWSVLDGYGPDAVAFGAYGQSLIPWPNRIAGGRYAFHGNSYQLPLTEPAKQNAIHGFARWMNWTVETIEPSRAVLSLVIHPRAGYPFALQAAIEYVLSPSGVSVTTTARNVGTSALPYANGFHPYLTLGSAQVDSCLLTIPARSWLPTDDRGIPVGKEPVDGTRYDFRRPHAIGSLHLDTGYADLIRDPDGMARVRLSAPDNARGIDLWMDRSYPYVMAFTGDTLHDRSRRRRSLGIEPMTAAPNAFQSGDGLRVLNPGEATASAWGLALH